MELEASPIESSDHPLSLASDREEDTLGKELFLVQMDCTVTCAAMVYRAAEGLAGQQRFRFVRVSSSTSSYMISEIMTTSKRNIFILRQCGCQRGDSILPLRLNRCMPLAPWNTSRFGGKQHSQRFRLFLGFFSWAQLRCRFLL